MSKRDKGASLRLIWTKATARSGGQLSLPARLVAQRQPRKDAARGIIELFDLPQILRHNARFDLDKLHWLNGEYVREMADDRFYELVASMALAAAAGMDTNLSGRLRQGGARYLQGQDKTLQRTAGLRRILFQGRV